MPYQTVSKSYELASRMGHSTAAVRAIADKRTFYIPAEILHDVEGIRRRVWSQPVSNTPKTRLASAIAVDGSYVVERVRDGLPSVVYGFAQSAAAYIDLSVMEGQKAARFVNPYEVEKAVRTALVTLDFPVAGAYTRQGVDIETSWREAINELFRIKKIEVNRLDRTLLELLFLLHGKPGDPAPTLPVNCPTKDCETLNIPVPADGTRCSDCRAWLFPTDVLRIHEEAGEEGDNQTALGRLMSVVELLVLVGLVTLLWEQSRHDQLLTTLFIVDGPLAVYGPPAKLRARALDYFQAMAATTPGDGPYICGIEKSGSTVDYAQQLARHDVLGAGDLLICDESIISRITNTTNPRKYGKETYWGRKFIYRARDGRVLVPTIMPTTVTPYDVNGGHPEPEAYPTLSAILDVIDRTGSSMYVDGIIPVAAAHGKAAFPIGIGTDVLRLVATSRLGLDSPRDCAVRGRSVQ